MIEIKPEELRIVVVTTGTGSFAPIRPVGIRVTHLPTGISAEVVQIGGMRSQHAAKEEAMSQLRQKLSGIDLETVSEMSSLRVALADATAALEKLIKAKQMKESDGKTTAYKELRSDAWQDAINFLTRERDRLRPPQHVNCKSVIPTVTQPTAEPRGSIRAIITWAEGLIAQLPKEHDGRNSWLMNNASTEEAELLRAEYSRQHPGKQWVWDDDRMIWRCIDKWVQSGDGQKCAD